MSAVEFEKRFPNPDAVLSYLEKRFWNGKPSCPHCDSVNASALKRRRGFYQCRDCRKQFSIRTNTIFQNTKLSFYVWFRAFYMLVSWNGISSVRLGMYLGITQKAAWFMSQRIREAIGRGKYDGLLKGIVECDEMFVGGLEKNKHSDKKLHQGSGTVGKIIVFGAVERRKGGRVKSFVVEDTSSETLQMMIHTLVEKGSTVYTDEAKGYMGLLRFRHGFVQHRKGQYKYGDVSTNKIESVWSIYKRTIHGVHIKLSRKHLQRYLDLFDFLYNERNKPTMKRIDKLLEGCFGGYMSYNALVRLAA